jgi:hypothetical protein
VEGDGDHTLVRDWWALVGLLFLHAIYGGIAAGIGLVVLFARSGGLHFLDDCSSSPTGTAIKAAAWAAVAAWVVIAALITRRWAIRRGRTALLSLGWLVATTIVLITLIETVQDGAACSPKL